MSTRSGKRIHNSFHERELANDTEAAGKTERKTRSKRQKENIVMNCNDALSITSKSRKRNNYVRYPTDDEVTTEVDAGNEKKEQETKVTRKNTLKEQDFNVPINNILEPPVDTKKTLRQTRRTRKFSENNIEVVLNEIENDNILMAIPETSKSKSKKNKKKKSKELINDNKSEEKAVSKKQSKKKRKKSSRNDSLNKNSTLKSDASIESFHSAAGSPPPDDVHGNTTCNESVEKSFNKFTESKTQSVPVKSENKIQRKKRKLSIKIDILENCDNSSNNIIKDDAKINHSYEFKNDSEYENGTLDKNKRKSSIKNGINSSKLNSPLMSFYKDSNAAELLNSTFEKSSKKKSLNSSISNSMNSTFEKNKEEPERINTTFEKDIDKRKSLRSSEPPNLINNTFEKSANEELVILNTTFEKDGDPKSKIFETCGKQQSEQLNITFEKSNVQNNTFEKSNKKESEVLNTTFEKDNDKRKSLRSSSSIVKPMNSTFEKTNDKETEMNTTFDGESKLNSTFNKIRTQSDSSKSKSSLDTDNLTFDKSNENSRISISDDSQTENIVNTTPLLIESSMDESRSNSDTSQKISEVKNVSATPLKREGTFTKDMPEVASNENVSPERILKSPSSPGSTPFPFSKGSQKKSVLNVTRSIEKAGRRSFSLEAPTRTTKVMFCSPVNNPAIVMQQKRKVIKSNLKGSNKSFIFDENESSVRPAPRKRSYTHNDVEEQRAKRKRLVGDQQLSVDRLSRPRTSSTAGKPESTTPSKKIPTPSKSKSDTKVGRTKLPNFAALHQRRFDKMESLDECQERKAKRARQLLVPTAPITVLERSSPRGSLTNTETIKQKEVKKPEPAAVKKTDMPAKKLPTLDSLKPGYTRFGFKMNLDVNPFSFPSKSEVKPKEIKPKPVLIRQPTLPSLTGTTSTRKEVAKQTVMREKSFNVVSEKRNDKRMENRSIIKGVRTNRRFDLQMKMRNIN